MGYQEYGEFIREFENVMSVGGRGMPDEDI